MPSTYLRELLADAQKQVAFSAVTPPGYQEPTAFFKKAPARVGTLNLNTSNLHTLLADDASMATPIIPLATPGGETMTMAAAILMLSRVAAAGAHIITRPDPSRAIVVGATDPIAGVETIARYFNNIEAAPFSQVADDAEINASPFPVSRATIDWNHSIQKSVRFELKRSYLRQYGNDLVVAEIEMAMVLGLARAADAVLLAAINASMPGAFSVGTAAAQGLRIEELRALVGTAGAGAAFRGDGAFTAANIPADITADMATTLVGAFNRAAVAIHEEVTLIAERRNTQGDLIVTAHANMIPLVPSAGKFWTVA